MLAVTMRLPMFLLLSCFLLILIPGSVYGQDIPNPEFNGNMDVLGFWLVPNDSISYLTAAGDTVRINFSKNNIDNFIVSESPNWFQFSDSTFYGSLAIKIPISNEEQLVRQVSYNIFVDRIVQNTTTGETYYYGDGVVIIGGSRWDNLSGVFVLDNSNLGNSKVFIYHNYST